MGMAYQIDKVFIGLVTLPPLDYLFGRKDLVLIHELNENVEGWLYLWDVVTAVHGGSDQCWSIILTSFLEDQAPILNDVADVFRSGWRETLECFSHKRTLLAVKGFPKGC